MGADDRFSRENPRGAIDRSGRACCACTPLASALAHNGLDDARCDVSDLLRSLTFGESLSTIPAVIEYDVECKLTFAEPIEEQTRRTFKSTVEGRHPGWSGAKPVVAWGTMKEASVYFVIRGEKPKDEDDASVAQSLCHDASDQVRGWAKTAGLPELSGDGARLRCQAIPRI
jgi:hypothetical protein